jgi:hypothetical protein
MPDILSPPSISVATGLMCNICIALGGDGAQFLHTGRKPTRCHTVGCKFGSIIAFDKLDKEYSFPANGVPLFCLLQ